MLLKTLKTLLALAVASILASCSSSRLLNRPYSDVADLARKEFAKNEWTKKSTIESKVREEAGDLEIEYYEWNFPDVKIYCEVEVVDKGRDGTKVYVFVRDCDSWWYPFNFNPAIATEVLDEFEKCLGWKGVFHSFEKPWMKR